LAAADELENVPGLKEGLSAFESQALTLGRAPAPAPAPSTKGTHRLGHSLAVAPVETAQTPDISSYPVHGLDVSHYENAIDWDKVKAQGLSFVFIKATEGGDYVDPDFQTNWQGAAKAGVSEGAYHFYDFCRNGSDQADNFIKTVPRTPGALPMVIDLEQSADCAQWPAKDAFLADLAAFVAKVKDAYGLTPILYINLGIYDRYLTDVSAGYKLWIADPSHVAPDMPAGVGWDFWQYAWHGTVDGIGSEVDLDVFNGDARALSLLSQENP
jgi:lysozyme